MRPKATNGRDAQKGVRCSTANQQTARVDDLRRVHIGDKLLNDHRAEPVVVTDVQYSELRVRDEHSLEVVGFTAVRQIRARTPGGNEIGLTNQHNQWSGDVTGIAAMSDTAPREARGLRKVVGGGDR